VPLLTLVVESLGASLRLISLQGELVTAAPVRGEPVQGLLVRGGGADWEVGAQIEIDGAGGYGLQLDLPGPESRAATVRCSLWQGRRELASEIPRHGRVLFSGLSPGSYRVLLDRPAAAPGLITLTLRGAR
jgi:hypothetical protein